MRTADRQDAGLSLIELVIAMALFALVAVMGTLTLNGTIRSQERLGQVAQENAELARALSLLRSDISAAVPMAFYRPDGPVESSWSVAPGGAGFSISIAGQRNLNAPDQAVFHRVTWAIDPQTGVLSRFENFIVMGIDHCNCWSSTRNS